MGHVSSDLLRVRVATSQRWPTLRQQQIRAQEPSLTPAMLPWAQGYHPEGRGFLEWREGSLGQGSYSRTQAGAEKCLHLEHPPAPLPPMALERSQLSLGTSPADPSGSKCEKSSFQTQLDIPRWQVSTNISICMRHFNQARSNKSRTINIRSCSPVVMTGKLAQKLEITKKREVCREVGEGRWEEVRGRE